MCVWGEGVNDSQFCVQSVRKNEPGKRQEPQGQKEAADLVFMIARACVYIYVSHLSVSFLFRHWRGPVLLFVDFGHTCAPLYEGEGRRDADPRGGGGPTMEEGGKTAAAAAAA